MNNAVSNMIKKEDFQTLSQIAVVNNSDVDDLLDGSEDANVIVEDGTGDGTDTDDALEEDGIGDETETQANRDETSRGNVQVPSTFTNLDETNLTIDDNWVVSNSESKFDFTRELGKDSFDDKEDFIRAIKLYNIRAHKHFEVVESRPTMWCIKCQLHEQGCKWQVRACKRKRTGSFEITKYMGPHTCLHSKQAALMSKVSAHSLRSFDRQKGIFEVITQKGKNVQVVNLDKKTCTCGKWEIFKYPCSHVVSACAKLSLNTWQYVHRCYSVVDYCATWSYEFSPLPHEAYWPQPSSIRELLPNSDLKRDKKGRPRSTRLRNGMDIKESKKNNRCGICKQVGHNRATCPSKPRRMDA